MAKRINDGLKQIDEDYDDIVEFVRRIACQTTFEEYENSPPGSEIPSVIQHWDLSEWHDAQIQKARMICNDYGADWKVE